MPQTATRSLDEAFSMPSPAERVFQALTDPAQLQRWFAEHVRVEPRVGGRYSFWGKHTPLMGRNEGMQKLTAFEPGRALEFEWHWDDEATTCRLEIEPKGRESTLRIRHTAAGPQGFDSQDSCWIARDFWLVAAGNLRSFLTRGEPAIRPDYLAPGPDACVSIEIEAPSQAVWKTLTTPSLMARWLSGDKDFPATVNVELRQGGAYSFGWTKDGETIGPETILELEPGRRLVHSWVADNSPSRATEWTLEPLGPHRTRLHVRQIGTVTDHERCAYGNGWASFLIAIQRTATSD